MKKISKKIILIKTLNEPNLIFNSNFYLVSMDKLMDINKEINNLFKKGLYRYILPGKFILPIKNYFKTHTYINYELNKNVLFNLINNKNIILFKYNNFIFLNNPLILRHVQSSLNFEYFNNVNVFKKFFLICLLFYVD
jgi:hypothetical protein